MEMACGPAEVDRRQAGVHVGGPHEEVPVIDGNDPAFAKAVLEMFLELWNHEQFMDGSLHGEEKPPSVADFAARMGVDLRDVMPFVELACSDGAYRISAPGFIFKGDDKAVVESTKPAAASSN